MLTIFAPDALLAAPTRFSSEVLVWLGVIVALGVLLAVVALWLRKRLMSPDDSGGGPIGFSLSDLRRLHAEGQLSDEELAQAEARTLSKSKAHYLGDDPDNAPADVGDDALNDPSTNDPRADAPEAENPQADPDKNDSGGSGR